MVARRLLVGCGGLVMLAGLGPVAGVASTTLAQGTLAADNTIQREGEGKRRAELDGRERKAFPASAWSTLADWQNGAPLSQTIAQDRPILVVTYADYLPTARRAVQTATRMAERFGKQGLIVVLVHTEQEWAGATKPKAPEGSTLLVAMDKGGQFRKFLDVDQDPDFYVVDRAGQLRFADIALEGVESAVSLVVGEKAGDASTLNERLKAEREAADRAARRTAAINNQATFTNIPVLPFRQPSESEYANADWPMLPLDDAKQANQPGATLPAKPVSLPEEGWIPKKPSLKGKVIVAYLWHPRLAANRQFNESIPLIDEYQQKHSRDAVFVGLLTRFDSDVGGIRFTDDDKNPEKLGEALKDWAKSRTFRHWLAPSFDKNAYLEATDQQQGGEFPVPAWLIISTDGVCRWWSTPKSRVAFDAALQQVIRNDPGVRERRKAETEWLKNNAPAGTVLPEAGIAPEGTSSTPTPAGGG